MQEHVIENVLKNAILDKTQADILQISKKWNWK